MAEMFDAPLQGHCKLFPWPPSFSTWPSLHLPADLRCYNILFICGRSSSRLDRKFTELELRRPFTVFQLLPILEENHHSFLIVDHDPLLYEDAEKMVEYLAQALK